MLSYKNIFLATCGAALMASCNKNVVELTDINSFNVKADSTRAAEPTNDTAYYTLGSKATFNFSGNPAFITFFSGEVGRRYIYRNRKTATGISKLVFTSALNAGVQPNSLRVMLSSDFKGVVSKMNVVGGIPTNTLVYDSVATLANIAAATWADITPTDLANSATAKTSTIDLSTVAAAGKKVFIAFKYLAQSGSIQNKWTITNLGVTNSLPDNTTYTIGSLAAANTAIVNYGASLFSPGWVAYTATNNYNWVVSAGTSLVITGASTAAAATSNVEAWTFMGSLDLNSVAPDFGVPLKDISAAPLPYQYAYPSTGKYDAVFAATNFTAYTSDTITRKIPVSIR
ncbi:MAG TPA: DUF5017 domain-containing protein [Phnomibacter sp.]|nr:DUF5017 domain-containing protein [Phnomibacter sp.]